MGKKFFGCLFEIQPASVCLFELIVNFCNTSLFANVKMIPLIVPVTFSIECCFYIRYKSLSLRLCIQNPYMVRNIFNLGVGTSGC